ncbi:MAG: metal ABC transporter permease [bacterium]
MLILELWYKLIGLLLPFSWAQYNFMKNALLAVLLITPLFAILGTMVVSNKMVFFTDVLGHSAFTGIALGVLLGLREPSISMIALAVILAIGITTLKKFTKSSMDTILGVILAFSVALGIVILSKQGGFARYTGYLIGDILAVTAQEIYLLIIIFIIVLVYWYVAANAMILTSINQSLAHSRMIKTYLVELSFSILVALVVMLSIRLVGILIINSLIVLPPAASRNFTRSISEYTIWSVIISIFSGITGLIVSYYWGTASGATIVLFSTFCYGISAGYGNIFL